MILEFRTNPDTGHDEGVVVVVSGRLETVAELTKKSHLFQLFDNEFELVIFVLLKVAGNPDFRGRGGGSFVNSDTPGQPTGGGLKICDFGGRPK